MRAELKDKEKAILEATLELVNNNGFHASSMSKIAQKANVAPATIYIYFENKQDLINKLYLHLKEEISHCIFADYEEGMSVEEGFRVIWNSIANYKRTHIKEALFQSLCDITPMINEETRSKGISYLQKFMDLCKRGQEEGIIKDCSLYLIYGFAINPLSFLVAKQQTGELFFDEEVLENAYNMAWYSIKK
ncbi:MULTISPECIES: TetR/AcrR family transcriptional regulator [Flavobacterium]|uniref:TetR/AcrR family transcriptional regulator n=1 Tax=Flavobacterium columnare TaxID=996 RepID=A0AA94JPL7_9FLAO|nr:MULTISPECIES: TetR/AcrR family transcriptional regulator [Flavobacterium]MCH4830624.1 TetR/AcrR family transcriptional regulator [Flavobacterium columnare]MCH4833440.1 TetR/AcrR family transcriptional regulator [Flavobacterium columnare]OWP86123.1 TetR family transcriptional regulator [Flavobacterium covae]